MEKPSEPLKPYGYVLILRALARAAIYASDTSDFKQDAALRVLCVLAEYSDQSGNCRVSADTIAARMLLSRQAVSRQIKKLEDHDYIEVTRVPGRPSKFRIYTDEVEDERFHDDYVRERREANKRRKKGWIPGYKLERHAERHQLSLDRYELVEGSPGRPLWYRLKK